MEFIIMDVEMVSIMEFVFKKADMVYLNDICIKDEQGMTFLKFGFNCKKTYFSKFIFNFEK
jgi:hypothetical protein